MSEFLRKNNCIEKSAKNKEDAIAAALNELGASREDVDIEILDEGSKGFLGIGARDARVKLTLKNTVLKNDVSTVLNENEDNETYKLDIAPKMVKVAADNDETVNIAVKFLEDIFGAMNFDVKVDAKFKGDVLSIELLGENMGIVIGKRGDTLDSLQYLTSLVVNQRSESYIKVSIDTENYREKRTEALISLSNRLADKVTKTGRRFTLEPMNPYERRIIHSNLQNSETVTTYSIGSEPYRKVVIAPKNMKPYKKDGYKRRNQRPVDRNKPVAEKTGSSYTTTYKADFKPQQHKAEYKNFEDYFAAHSSDDDSEE